MAVTSVEVISPPSGITYPDGPDGIERPEAYVEFLEDGTGPYDVLYEWDTSAGFDSGSLIQVTNPSASSPDTAVPTGDLGPAGTTWFLRVTVIDTGDGDAETSSPTVTLNWFDPVSRARYLQIDAAVGIAFEPTDDPGDWGDGEGGTVGADGDTIDFARHLQIDASVGVGFDPVDGTDLGDDETNFWPADGFDIQFDRFLHLQANITTTQPCPIIFSIVPTVVREGDAVVIRGQGLVSASSPATDDWGAEVRLYETPSHAAAYVVMPTVSYIAGETEDRIVAQVPAGATNGHVAVVHTDGTPTCSGSNFRFLVVLQVESDPDAGWWIEAWTVDGTARILTRLPVSDAGFQKIRNEIGSGWIELPDFFPDPTDPDGEVNVVDQISDPDGDPKIERLIRVYLDGQLRYAFFSRIRSKPYGALGEQKVRISGPGREEVAIWAIVPPNDYPAARIESADTIYGSSYDIIRNGGFEDGRDVIENGGFDDGTDDPWSDVGDAGSVLDGTTIRSGTFSYRITSTAVDEGVEQEVTVEPELRYYIEGYVRDTDASGASAELDAYYLNDDDDEVDLDSDSVALNTTWRRLAIVVNVPENVTAIFVRFRQTSGSFPHEWYIDDVSSAGDVTPWTSFRSAIAINRAQVAEGDNALRVIPTALNGGARQIVRVTPNTRYTFTARVTGTAGEVIRLRCVIGGDSQVDNVTLTGTPTFDQATISGVTGSEQTVCLIAVETREETLNPFWVDLVTGTPGEPATSPGGILDPLLVSAQDRGTIPFVSWTFDADFDSNGEAWEDPSLSLGLRHGEKLLRVLDRLVALGADWEVTDSFEFRLVNRLGIDWTELIEQAPVISDGKLVDADLSGENPRATRIFIEGAGGVWTSATRTEWEAILKRREEWVVNNQAADTVTLGKLAQAALSDEDRRANALKLIVTDTDTTRPFVDYDVGDTINVSLVDEDIVGAFRIQSITVRLSDEGAGIRFILDLNRLVYEQKIVSAVQQMLTRGQDRVLGWNEGTIGNDRGGGSGDVLLLGAPSEASLAAHRHLISEIEPLTAGGDLGGQLPNPIVVGIRNIPVSADSPLDGQSFVFSAAQGRIVWSTVTGGGGGGGVSALHIGTDTVGGTGEAPTGNRKLLKPITLDDDGIVVAASVYISGITGGGSVGSQPTAAIYADNGGVPGQLVAITNQYTSDALLPGDDGTHAGNERWVTVPLAAELAAGDYWLGIEFVDSGLFQVYYDSASSDLHETTGDPWWLDGGILTTDDPTRDYSFYAVVLTAGAGGGGGGVSDHDLLTGVSPDDHHTEDHAARHSEGAADAIDIVALSSGALGGGFIFETDGAGGLQAIPTPTGGGGSTSHGSLTGVTANQHHTENHAGRHSAGGADVVDPVNLSSGAQPASRILETDGLGGFQYITTPGGGGGGSEALPTLDYVSGPTFEFDPLQIIDTATGLGTGVSGLSGLVMSRKTDGIGFFVRDHPVSDSVMVYGIDFVNQKLVWRGWLSTSDMGGTAGDLEALVLYENPSSPGQWFLEILDNVTNGDTGVTRKLYRFVEPDITLNQALVTRGPIPSSTPAADGSVFNRRVNVTSNPNCEAMVYDPSGTDEMLFFKRGGSSASDQVLEVRRVGGWAGRANGSTVASSLVGTIIGRPVGVPSGIIATIGDADITLDGCTIITAGRGGTGGGGASENVWTQVFHKLPSETWDEIFVDAQNVIAETLPQSDTSENIAFSIDFTKVYAAGEASGTSSAADVYTVAIDYTPATLAGGGGPFGNHAASHEDGGGDPIQLGDLEGVDLSAAAVGKVLKIASVAPVTFEAADDDTGTGSLPTPTSHGHRLLPSDGDYVNVDLDSIDLVSASVGLSNPISKTGGSGADTGTQDIVDLYTSPRVFKYSRGIYRYSASGVDLTVPHSILRGAEDWHAPVAESGNTGATNADIMPATIISSVSLMDFITIDTGSGDWRMPSVHSLAISGLTGSYGAARSGIRLIRGHSGRIVDVAIWHGTRTSGGYDNHDSDDLGFVAVLLDPGVTNGVQYTQYVQSSIFDVHRGIACTGGGPGGSALRCQDFRWLDSHAYNEDPSGGPLSGSVGVDFHWLADSIIRGGELQFWDWMVIFAEDHDIIDGTSLEQSSAWSNKPGTGAASGFIWVASTARWTRIYPKGIANPKSAHEIIQIDSGALDTSSGQYVINQTTGAPRHAITTDNAASGQSWDEYRDIRGTSVADVSDGSA